MTIITSSLSRSDVVQNNKNTFYTRIEFFSTLALLPQAVSSSYAQCLQTARRLTVRVDSFSRL